MGRLVNRFFGTIVCLSVFASLCNAQKYDEAITENQVGSQVTDVVVKMPDYRELKGGAKINVRYEGEDWPVEMMGAFEYAVKLWEENLPASLPIKIVAKLEDLGHKNILSRVSSNTYINTGNDLNGLGKYAYPTSTFKIMALKEYNTKQLYKFVRASDINDLISCDDMTIRINSNLINEFSCSLNDVATNKYDLVTAVLRDIATGLGLGHRLLSIPRQEWLSFPEGKRTRFETYVIDQLGEEGATAYGNATKGELSLFGSDTEPKLYAPAPYINGKSLSYFIPAGDALTRLMTYDFCKGYVMRDLSDFDWERFFTDVFDWNLDYMTGAGSNEVAETGSTDNVLPFSGECTLDLSFITIKKGTEYPFTLHPYDHSGLVDKQSVSSWGVDNWSELNPYSIRQNPKAFYHNVILSVQLKDGTWDRIYSDFVSDNKLTLNIDDLELNYKDSEYARSTYGGLKYRLVMRSDRNTVDYNGNPDYDYKVKYFTREFTPQVPEIKFSRIYQESNHKVVELWPTDEYSINVEIGIKNIEGTTAMLLEHKEEGFNTIYEHIEDFQDGYFIVNLDRESNATLRVQSKNGNGYEWSKEILIPAIGYPDEPYQISLQHNNILVSGGPKLDIEQEAVSYRITNVFDNSVYYSKTTLDKSRRIDISSLPKGIYIISIEKDNKVISYNKFIK